MRIGQIFRLQNDINFSETVCILKNSFIYYNCFFFIAKKPKKKVNYFYLIFINL